MRLPSLRTINYRMLAPVVIVILLMAIATGTVWSMSSTHYKVAWDSIQGANVPGGVSYSASYRMEGSFGGAISVAATSTSYQLCSGFMCAPDGIGLLLPIIMR